MTAIRSLCCHRVAACCDRAPRPHVRLHSFTQRCFLLITPPPPPFSSCLCRQFADCLPASHIPVTRLPLWNQLISEWIWDASRCRGCESECCLFLSAGAENKASGKFKSLQKVKYVCFSPSPTSKVNFPSESGERERGGANRFRSCDIVNVCVQETNKQKYLFNP